MLIFVPKKKKKAWKVVVFVFLHLLSNRHIRARFEIRDISQMKIFDIPQKDQDQK